MIALKYVFTAAILLVVEGQGISVSTDAPKNLCFSNINDTREFHNVGTIWNTTNPCIKLACDNGPDDQPYIKELKEYCPFSDCDTDYDLIKRSDECCGVCIKSRCKANETGMVHRIDESWQSLDKCDMFVCEMRDTVPTIASYKRSCPKVPENCRAENIYVKDCCQHCKSDNHQRDFEPTELDKGYDYMTLEAYRNHPCVRECKLGAPPMTCQYTFKMEWYETLSKACYDCPFNVTDCSRPHCIPGDGVRRSVLIINRMMPGPQIEVCFGDKIVVDVKNDLMGEATTIHWHGLHQRDNPYMDGVPHISQCPISPGNTFRYEFPADVSGTHFWHSHIGMQRGDGAFGALIIKSPQITEQHAKLYDYDLTGEHVLLLQDWAHIPGVSMFASHHHSIGDNKPPNILINGKGKYFVKESFITTTTTTTTTSTTTEVAAPTENDDITTTTDILFEGTTNIFDETTINPWMTTNTEDAGFIHDSTDPTMKLKEIAKDDEIHKDDKNAEPSVTFLSTNRQKRRNKRFVKFSEESKVIPFHTVNVTQGKRYRFRLINAEFLNCPMELSIDNHTVTVLASDGYDIEPVEVSSFVSYAGERFDFVVNANQAIDNYWIRLKGLMDCGPTFTRAFQVAILRYNTAPDLEPLDPPSYDHVRTGLQLNALNKGSGFNDSVTIAELKSGYIDDVRLLKAEADHKFFVYYDFYRKDNPHFHVPNLYGFNQVSPKHGRVLTPQLNHISMKNPSLPLMPNKDTIDDSAFCNASTLAAKGVDCREEFCECSHVLQVPLHSVVELILIDEGFAYDANHPFHLHVNSFRVIGMDRLNRSVTVEEVERLDKAGELKRNLISAPIKDTVTIPDGGYTIIRFVADNPGYWLFHCHIEFHAEIGMALIFKVGETREMKSAPANFPTCHDYYPSMKSDKDRNGATHIHYAVTMPVLLLVGVVLGLRF